MSQPTWKTWEELREILRLVQPSYEERQLERYVQRECLAADILETCNRLGIAVPLSAARAVATDMVLNPPDFGRVRPSGGEPSR